MFANLVLLFPDKNVTSALFDFLRCWNVFIIFHQKIANCAIKLSNSELQKASKIIEIPHFLSNADVSNQFAKFQCFDKKMSNGMFPFHPKPLITTKYKCQEEEKVETENSI